MEILIICEENEDDITGIISITGWILIIDGKKIDKVFSSKEDLFEELEFIINNKYEDIDLHNYQVNSKIKFC